jgi:hypothetical protein
VTAPHETFTAQLRARQDVIRLGADDAPERWNVRVQVQEAWDAVRFSAPPTEPVIALKVRALEVLYPDAAFHEDFVTKLNGVVVTDENASLAEAGATDGSIFLVQYRRRRPVR